MKLIYTALLILTLTAPASAVRVAIFDIEDAEEGRCMPYTVRLTKEDAIELGKWLLDLDAVLDVVKAKNPYDTDYACARNWNDGVDAVGVALKGGGDV